MPTAFITLIGKMTINPSLVTTKSITNNPAMTIRLLGSPPTLQTPQSPPVPPNEIVGVFNGATSSVALYISDSQGLYYLRITDV